MKDRKESLVLFEGPAALALQLRQLHELIEKQTADALADAGSRVRAQWTGTLLWIDGAGSASPAEIARRLGTSHQLTTQRIAALEQAGLVATRPDPADGRRRLVTLTPAGKREATTLVAFMRRAAHAYSGLFEELGMSLLDAIRETGEALRERPLRGRLSAHPEARRHPSRSR